MKRKIAIFTGNRAEYGLQFPILKAVKEHEELEYKLLVSGAHLDKNFGNTLKEINKDGFEVHEEIKIDMDAASLTSTVNAIGSGVLSIGKALQRIRPDIMVVYADRFEGFAAVIASSQMNIPTAHIEGGDLTEGGALDDSVRHAMTKLAHLHFTTNEQASNRLLAMGEEPWRVHTAGFPALDLINEGNFANPLEIEEMLKIDVNKPIVLFTQHSVTTEFDKAYEQVSLSLLAIKELVNKGIQCIVTYPNNDAGGKQIIQKINELENECQKNIIIRRSLGRYMYHGVLALARNKSLNILCIGNSSSGIKETPAFGCPTINIGSRQNGRLRANNVLDVDYDVEAIIKAVEKCFSDDSFRNQCFNCENPYYAGGAGKKISGVLSSVELGQKLIRKKMTLLGEKNSGWYR